MLGNFAWFFCRPRIFFEVNFNKSLRKNTIRVSNSFNPDQSDCSVVPDLVPTFTNSLDPDQAQQNVRPDLDPNWLRLIVFLKYFFEKANFEKLRCPDLQKSYRNTIRVTNSLDLGPKKLIWPRGYTSFFMLNSTEHQIPTAHKNLILTNGEVSCFKSLQSCIYHANKC